MLEWLFIGLERWGLSRLAAWLSSIFRRTPEKDMEEAHEVENKIDGLSPDDIEQRVRDSLSK